ncbi:hypothetical protein [Halomonas sp. 707B3]|uniref:hypothetical protein n=1 Tax=Halomonas sp. 707B3 TaxID=1681043 RepID=UPI00209CAD53|nr:hypothetical protein [Halomonas sp. 707B3]MCP1317852.1 hypothetical protein [Halomonas sp. 707B3]
MTISMDRILADAEKNAFFVRPPLKIELSLVLLVEAYHESRYVCALDALRVNGDTCWHSSVAELRDKGLEFLQKDRPHMHRHGGKALYQDYRLSAGSIEKAENLLRLYQAGRSQAQTSPRKSA